MLPKELIEEIRLERVLLDDLIGESDELIKRVAAEKASVTDKLACGSVLQSFYNGIERIFVCIAEYLNGGIPEGVDWRHKLLPAMAEPTSNRPAVISAELLEHLKQYKDFREAFRYAHYFRLSWEQTTPMVVNCPKVLELFGTEIDAFLAGRPVAPSAKRETLPRPFWSKPVKVPPPGGSKPMAVASGLALIAGMWIGLAGMILYYRFTAPPLEEVMPNTIIPKITELRQDPGYKNLVTETGGKDYLQKLFEDEELKDSWTFEVETGQTKSASSLEAYTGRIKATNKQYGAGEEVFLYFLEGKLASVEWSGVAYRFHDGKLVQFDQYGGEGKNQLPVSVKAFNRLGLKTYQGYCPGLDDPEYWSSKKSIKGPSRTDIFYQNNLEMIHLECDSDGNILSVILRNGKKLTKYYYDNRRNIIRTEPVDAETQPATTAPTE